MAHAFVCALANALWSVEQAAVSEPVSTPEPTIVEADANVVSVTTIAPEGDTEVIGEDLLSKLQAGGETPPEPQTKVPPFFSNTVHRRRNQPNK